MLHMSDLMLTHAHKNPLWVGADEAFAPGRPLDDELSLFKHGNVLLHRGERHVVLTRQLGHGDLLGHRAAQDIPPRRRRQRVEEAVHLGFAQLNMYNHLVVLYAGWGQIQGPVAGSAATEFRRSHRSDTRLSCPGR